MRTLPSNIITGSRTLASTVLLIAFFSLSCKDNGPVTPPDPAVPGRRDYTWTLDTLYSPMTILGSIWGSSATDIWVVGSGGYDESRLFHFDGTKWTPWTTTCEGNSVFGTSANDVWMGGGDGQIWHFDGAVWSQFATFSVPGTYAVDITHFWGTSKSNVFATSLIALDTGITSQRGAILHFDGSAWHEYYRANFYSQFVRISGEAGALYIFDVKVGHTWPDTVVYSQLIGSNHTDLYREVFNKIVFANLNEIGSSPYFVIGRDIYHYAQGMFQRRFTVNDANFDGQVYGRSEKDVFIPLAGGIAHYNGSDFQRLVTFSNSYTFVSCPAAIFSSDVFFVIRDRSTRTNMILHGHLSQNI